MAALASLNPDTRRIEVAAQLFFYGTKATPALGQAIADEIMTLYNAANGVVVFENNPYEVVFDVAYVVVESWQDLLFLCRNNRDPRNNFIRIEEKNLAERSFMGFGLGNNVGHWLVSDNLGTSTTAAHEFGHSLGLDHPAETDWRGRGVPPIMAPRGTLVDSQYQWNPEVEAGEFGGTMNPIHRKVTAAEVQAIFKDINWSDKRVASLGHLTNLLFDEVGNRVAFA